MDQNYTLKYRTYDQLIEDVSVDMTGIALENKIEPQQLIKIARKVNYDLGLRINQTKEVILDVCHGKVKLPDDFDTFNLAYICGDFIKTVGYDIGGTNIQEVPYTETPASTDPCAAPTVNCSACNSNPCQATAAGCLPSNVDLNKSVGVYGDTCIKPRVFTNCKNDKYELIQIVAGGNAYVSRNLLPLRMRSSRRIEAECPNLYVSTTNEGWIRDGFLFTSFTTGKVYLNYQGEMEDEHGNLLVPDHPLLNEYYEYAIKSRILENLYINGEDVAQRMQFIEQKLRPARNNALSVVNMPNFKELQDLHWANRKAMYSRYYDMFKS
tara:strand:+ start:55 stop:1026 length:972 start_codon:yes stop_codon:yes gene_type:complete